ncbi:MAG TPA: flagellar motor switch protein FliN, partial [Bacillota bacterium]
VEAAPGLEVVPAGELFERFTGPVLCWEVDRDPLARLYTALPEGAVAPAATALGQAGQALGQTLARLGQGTGEVKASVLTDGGAGAHGAPVAASPFVIAWWPARSGADAGVVGMGGPLGFLRALIEAASAPAAAAEAAPTAQAATVTYPELVRAGVGAGQAAIDLLYDVPLEVTVVLGRTRLEVRQVLALGTGSIVELDKLAGEPVEVLVNGKLIARGEVVVIDEHFGVRVQDIVSRVERIERSWAKEG